MKSNEEILDVVYKICHNIEYEVDGDGTVTIIEKQEHKIQKFFRILKFKIPLCKKTILDEYCSLVFLQIDGKRTIREIGGILEFKFGNKVYPLYERLLIFLNHIQVNCKYIENIR